MTNPTHDLAIARAERDAWQSTCEELHRTIAGRDVEIEAHLGRCEAADQRARSLDAALTAEREASKGMRASAYENRGALVDVADDLHVDTIDVSSTDVATRCGVAIANLRFELAAIRDLVAPGNPQGTVVDAVRAMATGLIESIGARDAAEQARDMARDSRDAAIARTEAAERTLSGLYDSKAELAKLRAEVAELTVTRDRLLAREHEDGRLHAQLRAELAELRARPVLTVERLKNAARKAGWAAPVKADDDAMCESILAALGPVTLPSPDRAEELTAAIYGAVERAERAMTPGPWEAKIYTTHVAGTSQETQWHEAIAGGPSSGTVVCETEWSVFEDESAIGAANIRGIVALRNAAPALIAEVRALRAAAEEREADMHARIRAGYDKTVADAWRAEVAPTLVAVSDEELATAYSVAHDQPIPRMAPLRDRTIAGIRAVRAKLGAAEVTEERVKAALCAAYHPHREDAP